LSDAYFTLEYDKGIFRFTGHLMIAPVLTDIGILFP